MLLEGITCPACQSMCKLSFQIADKDKTEWIFCSCGTVFHQKKVEHSYFNNGYKERYNEWKGVPERFNYIERVYMPIIEELTHSKRFLDVGFGADYHIKNLKENGWFTNGIELHENEYIQGDFETYEFKDKYDFIKLGDVIGAFENPIKALYKVHELLNNSGCVLITAPDAEVIYALGMFQFGNWNPHERWVIFSEKQMVNILKMLNFNIILHRKNLSKRFIAWNNYHIIAQKGE